MSGAVGAPVGARGRAALVALLLLGVAGRAWSQDRLVGGRLASSGVVLEGVSFGGAGVLDGSAETGDTVRVRRLTQFTVPISASMPVREGWTLDVTSLVSTATVTTARGVRALGGLGDVRVRAVGRVLDDRVVVTAGLNVPSGRAGLTAEGLAVLRVAAAPMLGLGAAPVTSGTGVTLGAVGARRAGPWALAAGGSVEVRGRYQPVAALTAGASPGEFAPGQALRLTLAGERVVGRHTLLLNGSVTAFTADAVNAGGAGAGRASQSTVSPGAVLALDGELRLAAPRVRELVLWGAVRRRGAFQRDGAPVDGSAAAFVDAGVRSSVPLRAALDLFTAADVRWQSGLAVEPGIPTLGGMAAALTVGGNWRRGVLSLQPFVRLQGGALRARAGAAAAASDGAFVGQAVGVVFLTRF